MARIKSHKSHSIFGQFSSCEFYCRDNLCPKCCDDNENGVLFVLGIRLLPQMCSRTTTTMKKNEPEHGGAVFR